ncbi:hypothetical protein Pelo_13731 [Pelomyxa schiedti]|nr:hypothetical protein Pelo_13731 [Pelomyxa schiedti]
MNDIHPTAVDLTIPQAAIPPNTTDLVSADKGQVTSVCDPTATPQPDLDLDVTTTTARVAAVAPGDVAACKELLDVGRDARQYECDVIVTAKETCSACGYCDDESRQFSSYVSQGKRISTQLCQEGNFLQAVAVLSDTISKVSNLDCLKQHQVHEPSRKRCCSIHGDLERRRQEEREIAELFGWRASCYLSAGDMDTAARDCNAALSYDPTCVVAHRVTGSINSHCVEQVPACDIPQDKSPRTRCSICKKSVDTSSILAHVSTHMPNDSFSVSQLQMLDPSVIIFVDRENDSRGYCMLAARAKDPRVVAIMFGDCALIKHAVMHPAENITTKFVITRPGKNSADFAIAVFLGQADMCVPQSVPFIIISGDAQVSALSLPGRQVIQWNPHKDSDFTDCLYNQGVTPLPFYTALQLSVKCVAGSMKTTPQRSRRPKGTRSSLPTPLPSVQTDDRAILALASTPPAKTTMPQHSPSVDPSLGKPTPPASPTDTLDQSTPSCDLKQPDHNNCETSTSNSEGQVESILLTARRMVHEADLDCGRNVSDASKFSEALAAIKRLHRSRIHLNEVQNKHMEKIKELAADCEKLGTLLTEANAAIVTLRQEKETLYWYYCDWCSRSNSQAPELNTTTITPTPNQPATTSPLHEQSQKNP